MIEQEERYEGRLSRTVLWERRGETPLCDPTSGNINKQLAMNSNIEFTFEELNALNKLLGQIKTEPYLAADEIFYFALSPFIISSIEKIHIEFMKQLQEQTKTGKLNFPMETQRLIESEDYFQLTDKSYFGDQEKRLFDLGKNNKDYIRQMDNFKREEFCNLIFAPFKPTVNQRKRILGILESMCKE